MAVCKLYAVVFVVVAAAATLAVSAASVGDAVNIGTPIPTPNVDNVATDSEWTKPVNDRFSSFVLKYGKAYATADLTKRFQIFQQQDAIIREHNAGGHSYKMGHNAFSDLTTEEFKSYLMKSPAAVQEHVTQTLETQATESAPVSTQATVSSLNWVSAGALNPIQNQASCGSCWAFATTAAFEASHAIDKHVLYKFSEQHVLDCSNAGDCTGGYPSTASAFTVSNGVYKSWNYLSYQQAKYACTVTPNYAPVKSASYAAVSPAESTTLLTTAATRPVIMTISVDNKFRAYKSGIFDAASCSDESTIVGYHAVPIVGFGTENGVDYWVVRNSWATSYGENGYIRIKRNANICKIGTYTAYTITFSQTGASCPAYTLSTGTDFAGYDIANAAASSFAGCAALCAANKACGAWTLYSGVCYMKSLGAATQAVANSGCTSGKCVNSNAACHTYTSYADTDFYGNDVANAPASSVADCFAMCQSLYTCGSFTYASGVCYMKTASASSGAVASPGATAGKCVSGCNYYSTQADTDYTGGDIANAPGGSIGECAVLCSALNTCNSFSLYQGVCYLKTAAAKSSAVSKTGVTSGYCVPN